MNLDLSNLERLPAHVARPSFDPRSLGVGILHLGVGNFHRAHQAVFTEDAIARTGGAWGIVGVSLKRPDTPRRLEPQDNLYTVEILDEPRRCRVMGVLRRTIVASLSPLDLIAAFASDNIRVATLTVTEKGYCLRGDTLDFAHPDVRHDIETLDAPRSTVGWIVRGLAQRHATGAKGLTIVSCDNLASNGKRLGDAVTAFARVAQPSLVGWIEDRVRFPGTMVDCIVPATDSAAIARVDAAIGMHDAAPVTREAYAQWVIEDRFAAERPAWELAGAEIVADVAPFERLKLHVLNGCHSALAYLGLPRGHAYVRQAIGDSELLRFTDALVEEEIAAALAPLDARGYWQRVRRRLANPALDHRLAQIAEDGAIKLAQRTYPLLIGNVRAGRPYRRLAQVVRAWLEFARQGPVRDAAGERLAQWARSGGRIENALDDPGLFPDAFRTDAAIRAAILESQP